MSARPATSASRRDNGQIRRIISTAAAPKVVARACELGRLRLAPVSKELYFTDNGRDWLSEDLPNDELNALPRPGQQLGLSLLPPGHLADSEFGWGRRAASSSRPVALLGRTPRRSMRFYNRKHVPAE